VPINGSLHTAGRKKADGDPQIAFFTFPIRGGNEDAVPLPEGERIFFAGGEREEGCNSRLKPTVLKRIISDSQGKGKERLPDRGKGRRGKGKGALWANTAEEKIGGPRACRAW